MTLPEYYVLRDDLHAIYDGNDYRLRNMSDAGKVAFLGAVARHALAYYNERGRGPALVAYVNMVLGG